MKLQMNKDKENILKEAIRQQDKLYPPPKKKKTKIKLTVDSVNSHNGNQIIVSNN